MMTPAKMLQMVVGTVDLLVAVRQHVRLSMQRQRLCYLAKTCLYLLKSWNARWLCTLISQDRGARAPPQWAANTLPGQLLSLSFLRSCCLRITLAGPRSRCSRQQHVMAKHSAQHGGS